MAAQPVGEQRQPILSPGHKISDAERRHTPQADHGEIRGNQIEGTYDARLDPETGCVNPEFAELPVGQPTFRVFAQLKPR